MGNIEKFDFVADKYDTDERIRISKIISETIRSSISETKEKSMIDFGCGTGLVGLDLADMFKSVIFVDASEPMVEMVKLNIEKNLIENASCLCWDLEKQSNKSLSSDYIIAVQVLLHIEDTKKILAELYKVLNNEGHLIIIDFDFNEKIVSTEVHNGFKKDVLLETLREIGFDDINYKIFYHGEKIFMGEDSSLFILDAKKNSPKVNPRQK